MARIRSVPSRVVMADSMVCVSIPDHSDWLACQITTAWRDLPKGERGLVSDFRLASEPASSSALASAVTTVSRIYGSKLVMAAWSTDADFLASPESERDFASALMQSGIAEEFVDLLHQGEIEVAEADLGKVFCLAGDFAMRTVVEACRTFDILPPDHEAPGSAQKRAPRRARIRLARC